MTSQHKMTTVISTVVILAALIFLLGVTAAFNNSGDRNTANIKNCLTAGKSWVMSPQDSYECR